jgi:hypothetical protein
VDGYEHEHGIKGSHVRICFLVINIHGMKMSSRGTEASSVTTNGKRRTGHSRLEEKSRAQICVQHINFYDSI